MIDTTELIAEARKLRDHLRQMDSESGEAHLLARLADALEAATQWRPIKTAPRDEEIIACGPFDDPCVVYWDKFVNKWRSSWQGYNVIEQENDYLTTYHEPSTLSHWLPLPTPPQEESE